MQQHTLHIAGGVARNPLVRLSNPVTLDFLDGEHIAIVVPNGAGKSTTIRGILGLIRRECGEVLFCGEPLNTDSVAMKEQIGVVFDSL